MHQCFWLGVDRTRWARVVYGAGLGREYKVCEPLYVPAVFELRPFLGSFCEPQTMLHLCYGACCMFAAEASRVQAGAMPHSMTG